MAHTPTKEAYEHQQRILGRKCLGSPLEDKKNGERSKEEVDSKLRETRQRGKPHVGRVCGINYTDFLGWFGGEVENPFLSLKGQ